MPDQWTVNGTETDGLEGSQTGLIPGETADYSFLFRPRPDWDDPTDDHIERYQSVRELVAVAGQFDSYESIDGTQHWREQTTQSPLVHIEPPDWDDPTSQRVWGLLDGYDDGTTMSDKRCILSLSVLVISTGDEFTTEAAIRTEREVTGP